MAQLNFHGLSTFFTQLKKIFATKTNINELETKLIGNILDESNPNDDTINGAKKYAQENITDLEDRLSEEIVSESNEWIIADEEDNIIAKINKDGFATTNITATKVTAAEEISAKKITIKGADIEEAFVSIKDELIGNSGDSADKDTIHGAKTHADNKVSDLKNELSESIVSQSDSWTIVDNETDGNIILTVDKNGLETTNITSQSLETTDITSDNIKAETTLTVANMNVKQAIEENRQEINNIKDGTTSAGKANQLAESIKLTLGKDMSGEVSFNGAEDITLNATSNIEINGDNEFIECEKISNETATQYKVAHKELNGSGAGTYTKVTVDEAGHVTIGTNPTTLAGYGVTDAYTKDEVNGKISEAISTAATDATNKANAAFTAANSYTDTVKNELSESITSESDSWTVADQNGNIVATVDKDGLKTTGVETNILIVDGKNIADYLSSYAEDIYFKEDIIVTEKVSNNITLENGSATIPVATNNLSLKDMFEYLWTKEDENVVESYPSINFSSTQSQNCEIGTTVTPSYSLSLNPGSYKYNPKETGVKATSWEITFNDTTKTVNGETASSSNEAFDAFTVEEKSYDISVLVDYNAATVTPQTNLGNKRPSKIIPAKTDLTGSKTIVTGYKPNFYGFKTTAIDINSLDYTAVRAFGTNQQSNTEPESSATCNSAWMQFFYAVPKGRKTSLSVKDSNNLPLTVLTKEVPMKHEGTATSTYTVFYINNASAYGATTLTLNWS